MSFIVCITYYSINGVIFSNHLIINAYRQFFVVVVVVVVVVEKFDYFPILYDSNFAFFLLPFSYFCDIY